MKTLPLALLFWISAASPLLAALALDELDPLGSSGTLEETELNTRPEPPTAPLVFLRSGEVLRTTGVRSTDGKEFECTFGPGTDPLLLLEKQILLIRYDRAQSAPTGSQLITLRSGEMLTTASVELVKKELHFATAWSKKLKLPVSKLLRWESEPIRLRNGRQGGIMQNNLQRGNMIAGRAIQQARFGHRMPSPGATPVQDEWLCPLNDSASTAYPLVGFGQTGQLLLDLLWSDRLIATMDVAGQAGVLRFSTNGKKARWSAIPKEGEPLLLGEQALPATACRTRQLSMALRFESTGSAIRLAKTAPLYGKHPDLGPIRGVRFRSWTPGVFLLHPRHRTSEQDLASWKAGQSGLFKAEGAWKPRDKSFSSAPEKGEAWMFGGGCPTTEGLRVVLMDGARLALELKHMNRYQLEGSSAGLGSITIPLYLVREISLP